MARGILFAGCSKKLAILDASSGKMLDAIEIGDGCDAVAFDPETKLVFASCGDGTTTVVREESPTSFKVATKIQTVRRPMLTELERLLETMPAIKLGFVATGAEAEEGYGAGYGYGYGYASQHEPVQAERVRLPGSSSQTG